MWAVLGEVVLEWPVVIYTQRFVESHYIQNLYRQHVYVYNSRVLIKCRRLAISPPIFTLVPITLLSKPQLPRGGTSPLRLTLPLGLQPSSVPLTISFPPLIVKIKENPVTHIFSKDQMSVGTTCTNWSLNIKVNIMLRACLYLTDWHI